MPLPPLKKEARRDTMYVTKQRSGFHGENTQADDIARPALLSRGAAGPGQAPERRALAEIGNLAGAMNSRCNVSKDGFLRNAAAVKPADCRKFAGASVGSKKVAAKAPPVAAQPKAVKLDARATEDATTWGTKQRRTSASNKVRDGPDVASSSPRSATDSDAQAISATSSAGLSDPELPDAAARKSTTTTSISSLAEYDVAMREIEDDLFNIDYADVGDELAVTDYVDDIHDFYRRSEVQSCVPHDYMARQEDVNYKMRAILTDWLIEVHLKFELMPETLFLTINVIDRYLCRQQVPRRLLQLVGVTAMLVAAKYEEIWAPEVDDFVYISDGAYTKPQLLAMERTILNTLQFNLTVPTPYVFMVRFLKAARADEKMEMVAWYMLELCLQEYGMLKFAPSMLAAAAIYASNHVLRALPRWTTCLHYHSGYCEAELKECAALMVGFHAGARDNSLGVVYRKYSEPKFLAVAKLTPPALQRPGVRPGDRLSRG